MNNRLGVIAVEKTKPSLKQAPQQKTNREEIIATFEREWLQNPEQFNPQKSCHELERIERTLKLIKKWSPLKDAKIADLGCGSGYLAKILRDEGGIIDAVDASRNALKKLENENQIKLFQDCLPNTRLFDDDYDLVVCTELIAHLKRKDYRLFMNEVARIVKTRGIVILSTPIDFNSVDAAHRFIQLVLTECEILDCKFSYHYLHHKYFNFNSKRILLFLESISQFLFDERAITHCIIVAKRKSLL